MTRKLRWGILGVANIAVKKVIPAMAKAPSSEVLAIASRNGEKARKAAVDLGIARAYGSYEELLADPQIDAIYNPLPNHLHVPWSIRAAEAGKHVLCEKPIALTVAEVDELIAVRDRTGVNIGEAFMVKTHPQWLRARDLVRSGAVGELRVASGSFSYFNTDPENVRNQAAIGGGALMDVGCYPVTMARFFFEREPARVLALIDRDPGFRNRSPHHRRSRLCSRPGGFHLQHAVGSLPELSRHRNQRPHRNCLSFQYATHGNFPYSNRRRLQTAGGHGC